MKKIYLLLLFVALNSNHAMAHTITTDSTKKVWQHHIEAWQDRDLTAIASDYDENSIMIINNKIFRGPEKIRSVFACLFQIFSNGENNIDPATIDGRIIYLSWRFRQSNQEHFGTDTFIVEGGKIAVQTIGSTLYEKQSCFD